MSNLTKLWLSLSLGLHEPRHSQLQARIDLQRSTLAHLGQTKTLYFQAFFQSQTRSTFRCTFNELSKVTGKVQRTPAASGSRYYSDRAGKFQGNIHRVLIRLIIFSPLALHPHTTSSLTSPQ